MNKLEKSERPEKLSKTQQLQQLAQRLSKLPEDKKNAFRQALQNKGIDPWKLPIVAAGKKIEGYPLSFAQQRLWFVEQMEAANTLYNLAFGLRFEGPLDIKALELSLNEICRRHKVLRTTFHSNQDGEGRQQIQAFKPWCLDVERLDVEGLDDKTEAQAILNQIIEVEARKPFDLSADLMFRFKLIQMAPQDTVGLFTIHHIAFDFLSVELMVREVAILYSHFQDEHKRESNTSPSNLLSELPIQYADFASWQRQWAASPNYQTQKDYWLQQLADLPARINLPSDYLPQTEGRHLGLREGLLLSPELSDQLRSLAQQHNVTLYMLMLSVFTLLLHRYSQQDDIAVGTSIANRGRPEIENILGFFVNLLVMRNRLAPGQSFASFLQQVNETAAAAYDHQDLPFDHLLDLLDVARDPNSTPLFQVLFVLTMADQSAEAQTLSGLKVSSFNHDQGIARYELTLRINDSGIGNALFCQFEYDCDRYQQSTIVTMLSRYRQMCQLVLREPQSPLRNLRLVDEKDAQQLAATPSELWYQSNDRPVAIHHMFEAQAFAQGQSLAVVYEQQTLSYAELNAKANQLAHHLRTLGHGPEARVALYMERSSSLAVGLLAVLKAGAAYVPLDTKWPEQRIKSLMADAGVNCVLSELRWQEQLAGLNEGEVLYLDEAQPAWANQASTNPESISKSCDAAYVIFTSGSSGTPKGVVIEHRQIAHYTQALMARLASNGDAPAGKSFAHISTIAADLGNTSLYGALCFGGSLHLISTERAFEPDKVAQYMDEHKVDVLKIVPSHLQGLLAADQPARLLPKNILILGGEACSNALLHQVRALSPQLRIVNHYGPTETTVGVLTHELSLNQPINKRQGMPLGRPLANTQAYVLDSERQLCPAGIPGELYIGGDGVARGYLNRAEMTAERFIHDPYVDQAPTTKPANASDKVSGDVPRLYRSGDRVRYLASGELEFLGRIDNQVKIRGYRVELGDIEASMRQLDQIDDAAIRLQEGEVSDQLVAYIVLREVQQQNSLKEISAQLSARLPEYMIPRHFEVLEALPLTLNGKLDWRALDDINQSRVEEAKPKREPRSEKEASLLNIIQQILRRNDVSIDDNFFELGGDSILSLQVIARAKRKGLKLTPKQFIEQSSIMGLAEAATLIKDDQAKRNQVISGEVPLTPIQKWFFEAEHPVPEHWNQSLLFQAKQALNPEALQAALAAIVRHHDQLRSEFVKTEDGGIEQRVMPWSDEAGQAYFVVQPCLDDTDREQAGSEKAELEKTEQFSTLVNQYQSSLSLQGQDGCGQLFKLVYFVGKEQTPDRLLLLAHHLLIDGVSWRVLLEDLMAAYQHQLVVLTSTKPAQSKPAPMPASVLPTKTTSFQQWSHDLQRTAEQHQQLWHKSARAYWQAMSQQLANYPETLIQTEQYDTLDQVQRRSFLLDAELTTALLHKAGKAYKTGINDLLLAALCMAFAEQGIKQNEASQEGQALYLELEGHGREGLDQSQDLSRTIGWFTSRFPVLLLSPDTGNDVGELITKVKTQLNALPLQGLSYGLLQYLDAMPALPKPTVSFNYLGQFELQHADQWFESVPDAGEIIERHPKSKVSQPLAINAIVAEGQLQIRLDYVPEALPLDIERLGEDYLNSLNSVIQHCDERQLNHAPEPTADQNIAALIEMGAEASELSALHSLAVLPESRKEFAVFCIHHVGGHTREYQPIAQLFPPEVPVYGIQARRMVEPDALEVSFQAMAEDYAQIMREAQPYGPYRLLGWSIGGVIAMAIAKALEDQGQEVAFVGLIDATMGIKETTNSNLLDNLMRLIGDGQHKLLNDVEDAAREQLIQQLKTLEESEAIERIIQWAGEQQVFNVEDSRHLVLNEDLKRHYRKLRQAHKFESVKAEVHAWWAEDSLHDGQWPVPWHNFCETIAGTAIYPGGHCDIIANPELHETIVSKCLKTCAARGDK